MHFFQEIKSYIGFDDSDAKRLRRLKPLLEPHFSDVVAKFYDALNANRRTREVFTGPEQVERLRETLHVWLEEVFEGPYNNDYFQRRQRIGRVHVDVGLLPQFMFGAMNIIRIELINRVDEADELDAAEKRASIESIERILDMELTIVMQSYWNAMMELKLQIPSALATGLAHEIRNPLNAIGLQMTLLERRLGGIASDEERESLAPLIDAVLSEVKRIHGLTSEIMDFAKPIEINKSWYDAGEFLGGLRNLYEPTMQASNIKFVTRVDGEAMILCDRDRIMQVLVNVLQNSVEAIEDEGTIEVAIANEDYGTTISVRDDGHGMTPALKYKIFDLFHTTKAAGTGIGLAIVKKIVEAHEGAIDISSKPDRGTTFTISLPRPDRTE
jgi:signal transduction histidine kinase